MVLGVMRPEMAMDFGSKEVEPRLMRGLSTDSPLIIFEDCWFVCWTENVHVKLLEFDGMDCVENDKLMHVI